MYKFIYKIIDRLDRGLSPRDKMVIVAMMLVISVLGIVLAVRYYDYIQKNPDFCSSCHLMEEAHRAWKLSGHSHIVCQDCHQLGLIEQNRLLVKFVFTTDRRTPEPHGLETPWKLCTKCHWDEAAQGSITVNKSIGHARHIFMEKMACLDCHSRTVHAFRPDETACIRCHEGYKIHGIGKEGATCLVCHPFSANQEGFIPDREKCLSCHRKSARAVFSEKAPMARLNCYECHTPHDKCAKPGNKDCLRCHTREVLSRKAVHQKEGRCTGCHKAHIWIGS
ncbi:MAG: hypothetical protein A2X56_13230 [Nitrospirae bacterium GWC2_57_13]|jgi:hypothetical protein|nr:MAG: hypothetical protein A2X56_13230 [Nitrospirae bacterium GWC2_57_13]OGW44907.1 MAG: hypothetical protein A2X57_00790 [Nitrospirae bacterium GWD2_57_8]HAS54004.1 hypothetical protein [Nitrospiraceae bacterium]